MDPLHILQSACINCPFIETFQSNLIFASSGCSCYYICDHQDLQIFLQLKQAARKLLVHTRLWFYFLQTNLNPYCFKEQSLHIAMENELLPITCNIPTDKLPPTVSGMAVLTAQAVHIEFAKIVQPEFHIHLLYGPCKFTISAGNKWPFFLFTGLFAILTSIKWWEALLLHNSESQHVTELQCAGSRPRLGQVEA